MTRLKAKLSATVATNDLVENLVVASMGMEHSPEHFRRVKNKAVIVGAD